MKLNLGKWGPGLAAVLGALATVVSDSVLDAPDIITALLAGVAAVGAAIAGKKAFESDPNDPK